MAVEVDLIEQRLEALTKTVDVMDAKFGAKLDQLIGLQLELARLREQQESSRLAIDRSFTAIRQVEDKSRQTEGDLARAMAFVKGGMLVGALLFGFAQWWVLDQLNDMKAVKGELPVIERRLMMMERDIQRDWSSGQ